jgi:ATP-dependent Clp protease adaptor protein ClpS
VTADVTVATMEAMAPPTAAPVELDEPTSDVDVVPDRPWVVIVWNDPINLMSYVTYVLQKLFGYAREKAEMLMWDVHLKGRAVVSSGPREKAEIDVFRLHEHGLWATMQRDE